MLTEVVTCMCVEVLLKYQFVAQDTVQHLSFTLLTVDNADSDGDVVDDMSRAGNPLPTKILQYDFFIAPVSLGIGSDGVEYCVVIFMFE